MITVGVTAVGGGVGQAVLRALGQGSLSVRTVGMDTRPMSPGLFWADAAYRVPPAAEEDAYITGLLEICRLEALDALIPGLDVELDPLSRHRHRFHDAGCTVIVGSPETVLLCRDKLALFEFCRDRDLPFVDTFQLSEALDRIKSLSFPVIVKPRRGMGSTGARLINGPEELLRNPVDEPVVVQAYLPPSSSKGSLESLFDRPGDLDQSDEISVQYFIVPSGEVLGGFASIHKLKQGVPWEVIPDPDSPALEAGRSLADALAGEGLQGPLNLQGRILSGAVRFFEANARFTGITAIRTAMGYREVEAAILAFVLDREEEARQCLSFVPGLAATCHVEETIIPVARVDTVTRMATVALEAPRGAPRLHGKSRRRIMPAATAERVMVTGANGYVGANAVAGLLCTDGIKEVIAAVRSEKAAAELLSLFANDPRLRIALGSLPDAPWPPGGAEVIVHCAALRYRHLGKVPSGEFFRINCEGTQRLLEAARRAGVARIIYLSTLVVYGTGRRPPWSEAVHEQPENPYGLSKWIGERLCLGSGSPAGSSRTLDPCAPESFTLDLCTPESFVPETVVLRPSQVYGLGHGMQWDDLPHKFAATAARETPIRLYAGGMHRLDLVHIRDLTDAICRACTGEISGHRRLVLNIGGGASVSVAELAALCRRAAADHGLETPAPETVDDPSVMPKQFGLDIRRAGIHLGWTPSVSIEEGIRELVRESTAKETPHEIT